MLIEYGNIKSLTQAKEFSGRQGLHRERNRKKIIKADTDLSAIHEWLDNLYAHKANTHRSYLIDAERLLLWALKVKEKPISSLEIEDYQEYFAFLDNPEPQETWCMPSNIKKSKRYCKDWRPFNGPLSPASKAKAVASINKMLKYWFEQGYIDHHPLSAINLEPYKNNNKAIRKLTVLQRAFSQDEWQLIMQAIEKMPESNLASIKNKARLRFIVMTLIYTALRRNELTKLTWNNFQKTDEVTYLVVIGKSGKPQMITLPDAYINEIKRYRINYQLGKEWPEANDYGPVVTGRYTLKAIGANHINILIKELLARASSLTLDKKIQSHLESGSAHWFRHTAATFLDKQEVDPMIIKAHMRHSSFETTEVYIHKDEKVKKLEIEKITEVISTDD